MKVDPLWDPLREDPRYRALLSAMGIPGDPTAAAQGCPNPLI